METFKLESARGHVVFKKDEEYILVDTGSPSTFHKGTVGITSAVVNFDMLEANVGLPITTIMGCSDLVKQKVLIDMVSGEISFGDDISLDGYVVPCIFKTVNMMGMELSCPFVEVSVNGKNVWMALDTGAPTSYAYRAIIEDSVQIGEKEDFHFSIGTFNVPLYNLSLEFAGETKEVEFGVLPEALEKTFDLQFTMFGVENVQGVFGGILFHNHKVLLDFANDIIIVC